MADFPSVTYLATALMHLRDLMTDSDRQRQLANGDMALILERLRNIETDLFNQLITGPDARIAERYLSVR